MADLTKIMGTRIKEKREEKGLSQKELAEKIDVTPSAINQYEAGTKNPSIEILKKIALVLTTETDYLLGMKEEDQISVAFRHFSKLPEKDKKIIMGNIKLLQQLSKEKK